MKKFFQEWFGKYGFGLIIPIAIIYFIFFHKGCNKPDQIKSIKSDTVVRITRTTDTFYRDRTVLKHDTIRTEIPVYVDTAFALLDYYTFKSVEDSFIGKNYHIKLFDTLYMNSLYARRATMSVTQIDSIITNTITLKDKPRIKGFAGLTVTSNLDKSYIFVNGGLQTKKENICIVGYDPFNKQLQGTYLLKIKLK